MRSFQSCPSQRARRDFISFQYRIVLVLCKYNVLTVGVFLLNAKPALHQEDVPIVHGKRNVAARRQLT
jgi:hypothetical protein